MANRGAACTTASVLAALGALGAFDLPALGPATLALGAGLPFGAPGLLDYVSWPGRRAPLDRRIEALAAGRGFPVSSRSGLVVPGRRLGPAPDELLVANLAWGQESPGRFGTWGWHALRLATYSTGGHSVVVGEVRSGGGWTVLDPNHQGLQVWPRPGLAVTVTRLRKR